MEEEPLADRLSRIDTLWSVVRRAHDSKSGSASEAQAQLLERYGSAIRKYLLGALRNQEVADELFQEFALKFVKGDFKNVDPDRGKFRAFVKTVLYRMIAMHFRKKSVSKERNFDDLPESVSDSGLASTELEELFLVSWRDDVLSRTWHALLEYETSGGGPYYTVLKLRVENASLNSQEIADQISDSIGKPTTSGAGRVLVHRSREKFSQLLIESVADSVENASIEDVESELIELRLMDYCRDAFENKRNERNG